MFQYRYWCCVSIPIVQKMVHECCQVHIIVLVNHQHQNTMTESRQTVHHGTWTLSLGGSTVSFYDGSNLIKQLSRGGAVYFSEHGGLRPKAFSVSMTTFTCSKSWRNKLLTKLHHFCVLSNSISWWVRKVQSDNQTKSKVKMLPSDILWTPPNLRLLKLDRRRKELINRRKQGWKDRWKNRLMDG